MPTIDDFLKMVSSQGQNIMGQSQSSGNRQTAIAGPAGQGVGILQSLMDSFGKHGGKKMSEELFGSPDSQNPQGYFGVRKDAQPATPSDIPTGGPTKDLSGQPISDNNTPSVNPHAGFGSFLFSSLTGIPTPGAVDYIRNQKIQTQVKAAEQIPLSQPQLAEAQTKIYGEQAGIAKQMGQMVQHQLPSMVQMRNSLQKTFGARGAGVNENLAGQGQVLNMLSSLSKNAPDFNPKSSADKYVPGDTRKIDGINYKRDGKGQWHPTS